MLCMQIAMDAKGKQVCSFRNHFVFIGQTLEYFTAAAGYLGANQVLTGVG